MTNTLQEEFESIRQRCSHNIEFKSSREVLIHVGVSDSISKCTMVMKVFVPHSDHYPYRRATLTLTQKNCVKDKKNDENQQCKEFKLSDKYTIHLRDIVCNWIKNDYRCRPLSDGIVQGIKQIESTSFQQMTKQQFRLFDKECTKLNGNLKNVATSLGNAFIQVESRIFLQSPLQIDKKNTKTKTVKQKPDNNVSVRQFVRNCDLVTKICQNNYKNDLIDKMNQVNKEIVLLTQKINDLKEKLNQYYQSLIKRNNVSPDPYTKGLFQSQFDDCHNKFNNLDTFFSIFVDKFQKAKCNMEKNYDIYNMKNSTIAKERNVTIQSFSCMIPQKDKNSRKSLRRLYTSKFRKENEINQHLLDINIKSQNEVLYYHQCLLDSLLKKQWISIFGKNKDNTVIWDIESIEYCKKFNFLKFIRKKYGLYSICDDVCNEIGYYVGVPMNTFTYPMCCIKIKGKTKYKVDALVIGNAIEKSNQFQLDELTNKCEQKDQTRSRPAATAPKMFKLNSAKMHYPKKAAIDYQHVVDDQFLNKCFECGILPSAIATIKKDKISYIRCDALHNSSKIRFGK